MATDTLPAARSIVLNSLFASAAEPEEPLVAQARKPVQSTRTAEAKPPSAADFAREPEPIPELSVYRAHTISILRRYVALSMAIGRVPSLCGREFFRTNTYIRPHSFEDAVHFVIDVEHCLGALDPIPQKIIVRVILQDYSWEHAARLIGMCRRKVADFLPGSIDQLTQMFLAKKILDENRRKR